MMDQTPPVALIADDEPGIRAIVRRTLEKDHWTVLEARDGGEALRMIEGGADIGLLVTDVTMPVLTGTELVAAVRKGGSRIPALYLTAHDDLVFAARSVLLHGETFLPKPFTPKGLREAVRDLVGDRAPTEESTAETFKFPAWFSRPRH